MDYWENLKKGDILTMKQSVHYRSGLISLRIDSDDMKTYTPLEVLGNFSHVWVVGKQNTVFFPVRLTKDFWEFDIALKNRQKALKLLGIYG